MLHNVYNILQIQIYWAVNFNREALYHGIEFNGAIMIGIQNLSIRFKCQRTLYFFIQIIFYQTTLVSPKNLNV